MNLAEVRSCRRGCLVDSAAEVLEPAEVVVCTCAAIAECGRGFQASGGVATGGDVEEEGQGRRSDVIAATVTGGSDGASWESDDRVRGEDGTGPGDG